MREDILQALSELIKEKTELKAEKIELGAIDDFEKQFKKAMDDKTAFKLISALRKAEVGFENNIKEFLEASKLGGKINTQAKDLGIDLPKTIVNKIASSESEIKEHRKYLSKIQAMYNMF